MRVVGHLVLLGLFLLAAAWAADRLWSAWQAGVALRQSIVPGLALLGFVSLGLHELRTVRRLRRRGAAGPSRRAA